MGSQSLLQTPDPTGVSGQARAYNDEEKRRRQRQAVQPLRADRVTNEPRDEPCDSHCDRDRCSGVQAVAPHPLGRGIGDNAHAPLAY